MALKDYYSILGLEVDSGAEDIKRAFRRLALQYHPDRNPENIEEMEAKFKEINEAYEVLGDEDKRLRYNRLLKLSGYRVESLTFGDIFNDNAEFGEMSAVFQRLGVCPMAGIDGHLPGIHATCSDRLPGSAATVCTRYCPHWVDWQIEAYVEILLAPD